MKKNGAAAAAEAVSHQQREQEVGRYEAAELQSNHQIFHLSKLRTERRDWIFTELSLNHPTRPDPATGCCRWVWTRRPQGFPAGTDRTRAKPNTKHQTCTDKKSVKAPNKEASEQEP